jgi:L-lactate dehydrogenase complex protein LldG
MSDARAEVLTRIQRATAISPSGNQVEVPITYRQFSTDSREDLIALLTHRLHDYDAQVSESTQDTVAEIVAHRLRTREVSRMVIPAGLQASFLPPFFDFITDTDLSYAELDGCDGILTESTLAIAETGTLVLQNTPGQGRRAATLVPDYHLCLVDAAKIVGSVPDAMSHLRATAHLPTTFISGPSATADIEMTRIKGVHGPRFLDVIVVLR